MAPRDETEAQVQARKDLIALGGAFYFDLPNPELGGGLSTYELWGWLIMTCQLNPEEQLVLGTDRMRFASMLRAGAVRRLIKIIIDYAPLGRTQDPALSNGDIVSKGYYPFVAICAEHLTKWSIAIIFRSQHGITQS